VASPQKAFGRRIRQLRERKNWTQEDLAGKCGRHWTYIGGIERGERNPTLRVIVDLARGLGVRPKELFPDPGAE
jgi:transcriptional regulator with XRE-family HTH domain